MTLIHHDTLAMAEGKTSAAVLTSWKRWSALVMVAVLGSCLYGASLSLVLRDWQTGAAALWLAASAGAAWCVFIPALWRATRQPLLECLDHCLVTMACGEVVLISGALVNLLLSYAELLENAVPINAAIVAISNVTMFIVFAAQMRSGGVAVWKTLALWMLGLNGSGALFFWLLYQLLHGA
jgi:hypothetical protein